MRPLFKFHDFGGPEIKLVGPEIKLVGPHFLGPVVHLQCRVFTVYAVLVETTAYNIVVPSSLKVYHTSFHYNFR